MRCALSLANMVKLRLDSHFLKSQRCLKNSVTRTKVRGLQTLENMV